MRITVVIPAYNEEKNIGVCLRCILDQKRSAEEIIVVDNNSTDRTAEIARNFGARVVEERLKGIAHARNAGFDAATGDIIARTDADSCVPRDWIMRIENIFADSSIDAVSGPGILDNHRWTLIPFRFYTWIFVLLSGGVSPMVGPNMAIRRDAWHRICKEVCLNDRDMHEDLDLALHLHRSGACVRYHPQLQVNTSGRRALHNPRSFFVTYPLRLLKMLHTHRR